MTRKHKYTRKNLNKSEKRCPTCDELVHDSRAKYCNSCSPYKNGKYAKGLVEDRARNKLCIKCGNSDIINPYQMLSRIDQIETKNVLCLKCYLKKRSQTFFGTASRWEELLDKFNRQGGICAYTGLSIKIGETASLDHIIPCQWRNAVRDINNVKNETTIENLQWVHIKINHMKHDLSESEFLEMCRLVIEHKI